MMKISPRTYIIALAATIATTVNALDVNNISGQLSKNIPNRNITQLSVTGSIDAGDLGFIVDSLLYLQSLDLSKARIEPADSLPAYSLMGLRASSLSLPASITCIGEGALASAAITTLTLPANCNTIGAAAFNGCTSLVTVSIDSKPTEIAPLTFKGCTSLIDINIPPSATSIGQSAFQGCTSLTDIALPAHVTSIGSDAFKGCTKLCNINFPTSLKSIGSHAFAYTALTGCDLASCTALNTIGEGAFAYCSDLTAATLPDASAQGLGAGIFSDCPSLKSISLPTGQQTLTPYILKDTGLTQTNLPEATTTIGPYALYNTREVTEMSLAANVDSIGDHAMANMSSLRTLDAKTLTSVPATGQDAFEGTASRDVKLIVAQNMKDQFSVTPQWDQFDVVADMSTSNEINIGDCNLTVTRDSDRITVRSTDQLQSLSLYNPQGSLLGTINGHDNTLTIIHTPRSGEITILVIKRADGTSANIKLLF